MSAEAPFSSSLVESAARLVAALRDRHFTVATAESCTGGLLSALITSVPGASEVIGTGFVTYADAAKTTLLGVPAELLTQHGAVSPFVAGSMAQGARLKSSSTIGLSTTGIAGPDGGTARKPVGLVYIGLSCADFEPRSFELRCGDIGRGAIRLKTIEVAIGHALNICRTLP